MVALSSTEDAKKVRTALISAKPEGQVAKK
jgi:hypothetical protein